MDGDAGAVWGDAAAGCAAPHFGQNAAPPATSVPHWLQKAILVPPSNVVKRGLLREGYHRRTRHTSGAVKIATEPLERIAHELDRGVDCDFLGFHCGSAAL